MLQTQMKEMLSELIEMQRIAGAALRIRKDGEIVFDECLGYANREKGEPIREKTIFPLASMTKLIIAVGVMKLVEEGKLSLNDNLVKFFPNYPEEKKRVRIRHLLNHSSSLGQGEKSMLYDSQIWNPKATLEEYIDKLGEMPFDCELGESADYCTSVNFDILGRIIEIASGQELEEWLKDHIFHPLGMCDTTFFPTEEQKGRMAVLYEQKDGELVVHDRSNSMFARIFDSEYASGAGGLYGTLHDYDLFTTMLCAGGEYEGRRIITENTLDLMRTPRQITDVEWMPGLPWGLGFRIFEHPEKTGKKVAPGTFGWSGAMGTHMFVHREMGICATFMVCQADLMGGASFISREIEKITFENL